MSRARAFISVLMVLILIALSGATVWAAPGRQDPPPEPTEEPTPEPTEEPTTISGVVQSIEIVTEVDEETGETTTTVLVTLLDETTNQTQTVPVSLEAAIRLGLVEVDENNEPVLDDEGNPTPNEDMIGEIVEIEPADVIEEDGDEAEKEHPVASALADFFADILGLDYDTVMGYHEEGMGFGVIAQACWMSMALEGDASLLGDILAAKKSHDFSSITLPNGETPTNWGQFRKAVMGSDKAKKNLGAIMSGKAAKEQNTNQEQVTTTSNKGQGKDKKGKGTSEDGVADSPGKGNDKDKGGPPAEPPGKDKDKDKDKGNDKDKGGSKGKGKGKG